MSMSFSQVSLSRQVRRYLDREGLTQEELGKRIGLSAVSVNRKLAGVRRWSLDDLDALVALGVPVRVPFEVVSGDRA